MDKALLPTFYFKDKLRYVKDYYFCFKTYAKRRWLNKPLLDVFAKEFKAYDYQYFESAIAKEKILVNKKPTTSDYILKDNDYIEHHVYRKEPPVYNFPIEIVFEDKDFLIIVYKIPDIYVLHRLDKLTSGLLALAKNQDTAYKFHGDMKDMKIKKTYIARVMGKFPEDQEIIVDKAIYCVSQRLSKYDYCENEEEEKAKQGKPAKTLFKRLWYDDINNTSLVECKPITGRTHQIRVHLKYLGHSIINDINYGGIFIGNLIEKHCEIKNKPQDQNQDNFDVKVNQNTQNDQAKDELIIKDDNGNIVHGQTPYKKLHLEKPNTEANEETKEIPKDSSEIEDKSLDNKIEINEDEEAYVMEIWLHSFKYKYLDFIFETKEPYWANKNLKFELKPKPLRKIE